MDYDSSDCELGVSPHPIYKSDHEALPHRFSLFQKNLLLQNNIIHKYFAQQSNNEQISESSTKEIDDEITIINNHMPPNPIPIPEYNLKKSAFLKPNEKRLVKTCITLVKVNVIVIFLALIVACIAQPQLSMTLIQLFLAWLESHLAVGSIVFVIFYVTCDILMLPSAMIFTFGAGFVYCHMLGLYEGVFLATFLVFIAEFIGSVIAFLIARYLLRSHFQRIILRYYPKFELIDTAVKRRGFKITFLLRLSPITPYSIFNYCMGLTSVTFKDYCLASFGILPNFFCCCLIGSMFHNLYDISALDLRNNSSLLIFVICGACMVIFGMSYVVFSIHYELKKVEREMKIEGMVSDSEYEIEINAHLPLPVSIDSIVSGVPEVVDKENSNCVDTVIKKMVDEK